MSRGLATAYVKSVWRNARVHAFYPPNDSAALSVGAVYSYRDGHYVHQFDLSDEEGFDLPDPVPASVGDGSSVADDGTSVDAIVNGTLPNTSPAATIGVGDVGAAVTLKGDASYAANLSDVTSTQLTQMRDIKRAIARRFWRNEWDTDWIVVTEVWQAERSTIVGGASSETIVELKGDATVKPGDAVIGDLAAKYTLASRGKASMTVVGVPGLKPFFRGYQFSLLRPLGLEADPDDLVETEWDPTL